MTRAQRIALARYARRHPAPTPRRPLNDWDRMLRDELANPPACALFIGDPISLREKFRHASNSKWHFGVME